ncbi:MAG: hypothetical protein FJZ49_06700 [Candidatus Verstraetearchaeota archaeon]|nr:hypothetical protein [Candidatus Verstraetearchaeota archaeon]
MWRTKHRLHRMNRLYLIPSRSGTSPPQDPPAPPAPRACGRIPVAQNFCSSKPDLFTGDDRGCYEGMVTEAARTVFRGDWSGWA